MDKFWYLSILLSGQLALLGLDLRERLVLHRQQRDSERLRGRSILFLCAVIVAYGALQFGGLALAPNFEELVFTSGQLIQDFFIASARSPSGGGLFILGLGVAGFYFAGLCDYLFHRFVSHSRPAWFTHEYHHLTTDVSVYMPGLCVRPFLVVSVFPISVVTIFATQTALVLAGHAGADLMPMVYTVVLAQSAIGSMSHSACLRRYWQLHRILKPLGILSPQEHWLHHASDLKCNYGNFIILWDRIFGTYLDPEVISAERHRAGLPYDQDFLGVLTFGNIKLPQSTRRRFQLNQFCYLQAAGPNPEAGAEFRNPATN